MKDAIIPGQLVVIAPEYDEWIKDIDSRNYMDTYANRIHPGQVFRYRRITASSRIPFGIVWLIGSYMNVQICLPCHLVLSLNEAKEMGLDTWEVGNLRNEEGYFAFERENMQPVVWPMAATMVHYDTVDGVVHYPYPYLDAGDEEE